MEWQYILRRGLANNFQWFFRHGKSIGMCYKVRKHFEIDHSHCSLVTWYIYIYILSWNFAVSSCFPSVPFFSNVTFILDSNDALKTVLLLCCTTMFQVLTMQVHDSWGPKSQVFQNSSHEFRNQYRAANSTTENQLMHNGWVICMSARAIQNLKLWRSFQTICGHMCV